jgi:hypothetical protein
VHAQTPGAKRFLRSRRPASKFNCALPGEPHSRRSPARSRRGRLDIIRRPVVTLPVSPDTGTRDESNRGARQTSLGTARAAPVCARTAYRVRVRAGIWLAVIRAPGIRHLRVRAGAGEVGEPGRLVPAVRAMRVSRPISAGRLPDRRRVFADASAECFAPDAAASFRSPARPPSAEREVRRVRAPAHWSSTTAVSERSTELSS